MKHFIEFLRFFFVSVEFLIVCVTTATYTIFVHSLEPIVSGLRVSNDGVKALLAIPSGICVWTFISGRKILFPEKDKRNVLQDWPEFWRLRIGFNAGLTWSVIFAAGSLLLWFFDFQKITPAFTMI